MTITRTTSNGTQEVLTKKGFRSRYIVKKENLQLQNFNNVSGLKKIQELKADCRIASLKKTIILNYT